MDNLGNFGVFLGEQIDFDCTTNNSAAEARNRKAVVANQDCADIPCWPREKIWRNL